VVEAAVLGLAERGMRSSVVRLPLIMHSVVDAGPLADSWRQGTGTPVWGTPYGPYSAEKGESASDDVIRAALATATR